MAESVWVEGRLPGLNEILQLKTRKYRGSYNQEKKRWDRYLAPLFRESFTPRTSAHIELELVERDKRRDPDNVAAGATKFILDSLVHGGVLPDDGWGNVLSLTFSWRVDKQNPGVVVTLRDP